MAISAFPSPKLIEVAGKFGNLDGVWIDQEHSGLPNQELELLLLACRAAGLDAFARVAPTDYATVMRPMEGGASGIMMAQVRSVAEVEQAVNWMKYHPVGERGMFLGNFEAEFGAKPAPEHVADCNRDRWTVIQIETAEAVECVEGIAAVECVDCLFVGPSDLSNNLGKPGNPMDPHVLGAIERIAAAAKANGKPWGVLSKTEEFALKCREIGMPTVQYRRRSRLHQPGHRRDQVRLPKIFLMSVEAKLTEMGIELPPAAAGRRGVRAVDAHRKSRHYLRPTAVASTGKWGSPAGAARRSPRIKATRRRANAPSTPSPKSRRRPVTSTE